MAFYAFFIMYTITIFLRHQSSANTWVVLLGTDSTKKGETIQNIFFTKRGNSRHMIIVTQKNIFFGLIYN